MSLKGSGFCFSRLRCMRSELWYPKIRLEDRGAATTVAAWVNAHIKGKRGYPSRRHER